MYLLKIHLLYLRCCILLVIKEYNQSIQLKHTHMKRAKTQYVKKTLNVTI